MCPSCFITVVGAGHGGLPDEAVSRAGAFFAKVLLGKDIAVSTAALYKLQDQDDK